MCGWACDVVGTQRGRRDGSAEPTDACEAGDLLPAGRLYSQRLGPTGGWKGQNGSVAMEGTTHWSLASNAIR